MVARVLEYKNTASSMAKRAANCSKFSRGALCTLSNFPPAGLTITGDLPFLQCGDVPVLIDRSPGNRRSNLFGLVRERFAKTTMDGARRFRANSSCDEKYPMLAVIRDIRLNRSYFVE